MKALALSGGMYCICGEPLQCTCYWPKRGIGGGILPAYRFYCPRCAGENWSGEKPLTISYDAKRDLLTIDGCRYAGALFRGFALGPVDRWMKIVCRDDGVITLTTAPPNARIAWEENT